MAYRSFGLHALWLINDSLSACARPEPLESSHLSTQSLASCARKGPHEQTKTLNRFRKGIASFYHNAGNARLTPAKFRRDLRSTWELSGDWGKKPKNSWNGKEHVYRLRDCLPDKHSCFQAPSEWRSKTLFGLRILSWHTGKRVCACNNPTLARKSLHQ